jgi:hypothetical protein
MDHAIDDGDVVVIQIHDQAPRRESPGAETEMLSYPRVVPAKGPEIGTGDLLSASIFNGLRAPALFIEGIVTAGAQALHIAGVFRLQCLEYLGVWFAGCDGYSASNAIPRGLCISGGGPTAVVLDKLATDWRLEYVQLTAQFSVLGLEFFDLAFETDDLDLGDA